MSMPILTLADVNKRYGSIEALSHVSFEVNENELVVVLGSTGAGKTTLLRIIAGLEQPDAGRVILNNKDITTASPAQRDVALVFQNFSLYPNKTVQANLAFPLQAPGRNLTEDEIKTRVLEVASTLHITSLLDRPANHLSGGEMQRVAIGRAIVRQPQLFLMDEPLTNLDAKLRETLRVEIIRLQQELGTPMIYVTHDQTEALSMADRIVVLSEGNILQMGSPKEIYNHPKTPEIASQLGYPPINLIPAHRENGQWLTQSKTPIIETQSTASKATLGIRPEAISTQGGKTPARVEVVEDMGPATILLANWGGEQIHILVSADKTHTPGDQIYPNFNPTDVQVWPNS